MVGARRYRVFVAFAVIAVFLLWRVSRGSEPWGSLRAAEPISLTPSEPKPDTDTEQASSNNPPPTLDHDTPSHDDTPSTPQKPVPEDVTKDSGKKGYSPGGAATDDVESTPLKAPSGIEEGKGATADGKKPTKQAGSTPQIDPAKTVGDSETVLAPEKEKGAPIVEIPDRKLDIGGSQDAAATKTAATTIHWVKPTEHFPVPSESLIALPTGKSEKIPQLQADFKEESAAAKETRLARLAKVKAEMTRAWAGYKKYAWLHDELTPVSKKFKDPFCGWAATIVDSLDTLWIMGMKDEFEDAVEAVKNIDFTTATRDNLPVFETTIRYLGGLLSAYDISGGSAGRHAILLDKAVELAEILMGAFDTPNRMPALFYRWRPNDANKPKRASSSANLAELGSLSMEFTRLAQLTKEDKYYDAVARITNALYDYQNRGTGVPGIFPEAVDTSGCNRTAEAQVASEKAAAMQAQAQGSDAKSSDSKFGVKSGASSYSGPQNNPDSKPDSTSNGEPDLKGKRPKGYQKRAAIPESKKSTGSSTMDDEDDDSDPAPGVASSKSDTSTTSGKTDESAASGKDDDTTTSGTSATSSNLWSSQSDQPTLSECIPQEVTGKTGRQTFHLGGGEDSTYEYNPKQHLLLGGLEPKYKSMYLKASEGSKQYLLYRPMVPGDRDLLFAAKVHSAGEPDEDAGYEYWFSHLACFLGGTFGLGGKMFDEPVDFEIAKKLTDACIWAYESTVSGVMPEVASAVPCENSRQCSWNETLWWQYLDPLAETRDAALADYNARQDEQQSLKEQTQAEDKLAAEAGERVAAVKGEDKSHKEHIAGLLDEGWGDENTGSSSAKAKEVKSKDPFRKESISGWSDLGGASTGASTDSTTGSGGASKESTETLQHGKLKISKRGDTPESIPPSKSGSRQGSDSSSNKGSKITTLQEALDMEGSDTSTYGKSSSSISNNGNLYADPSRPLSHKEYVQLRIENEQLPPGFAEVDSRKYLLRPEAIESVWYMWRMTGDKYWPEKGWKMFEAIVRNAQTEAGASSFDNVLSKNPDKSDGMESFWTAETLKYFYLLYSEPTVISLDEWVLNTEAHPFKRPT